MPSIFSDFFPIMYVFSLFFKHALLMEANSFIMLWHASLLLQVTRTVTQIVYSEYLILLSLGLAAAQKRRKKTHLSLYLVYLV